MVKILVFLYRILLMKLQFKSVKELSGRTKLWYRSRRVLTRAGFDCRRSCRTVQETMQVDRLVVRGAQTMYALGTLKHHGLSGPPLWEVTRATFIARLTYASQAWWGLLLLDTHYPGARQTGEGIEQGCKGRIPAKKSPIICTDL